MLNSAVSAMHIFAQRYSIQAQTKRLLGQLSKSVENAGVWNVSFYIQNMSDVL